MLRVLHVITGLGSGGAETFIMNIYRRLNHLDIQFDFLLRSSINYYSKELENNGSYIYYTASFPRHFIKNYIQITEFFKTHEYDIIHVHGNALIYVSVLSVAKKAGVNCRIMHSHNTNTRNKLLLPIHYLNKCRIKQLATDYIACSDLAGKWMFGDGYRVFHNVIDLELYKYSMKSGIDIRKELEIPIESLVIGNVGRFAKQKNHVKLIEIFESLFAKEPNSYLVLVGEGILKNSIQEMIRGKSYEKHIKFTGVRSDVNRVLNSFDIFVFPSLYEGLAFVLLEAQANGLPIICSDTISKEAIVANNIIQLSLSKDADYWAKTILATNVSRQDNTRLLFDAGFDVEEEAKRIQMFYLEKLNDSRLRDKQK